MKDNYFSSYSTTRFIIDNHKKLGKIAILTAVTVLFVPVMFGFFSFLGKTVDAYNKLAQQQHPEILGTEEKTVRAEEEFAEVIATGKTVSIEERSRILKKISSEIQSGDRRALVLRAYLETMPCSTGSISPLADYTKELVEESDKNGLDWRYTTAIAGVETWFGCAGGAEYWHNAWGYGGGPKTRFKYDSWPEGIEAYTRGFVSGYGTKIDFRFISSYYTTGLPGVNERWANGVESYLRGIDRIDAEL